MQQVVRPLELFGGERHGFPVDAEPNREDELRFAVGLRFAIPAGLALWGAAIWGMLRFIV